MSRNATISCGFALPAACPQGRLSFATSPVSSEKYYSRLPLAVIFFPPFSVVAKNRTEFRASAPHVCVKFSYDLSSESDFHNASTRFLVSSSINISSGHGRVNPSDAHLRVASIPIFDPKSCIRAA